MLWKHTATILLTQSSQTGKSDTLKRKKRIVVKQKDSIAVGDRGEMKNIPSTENRR